MTDLNFKKCTDGLIPAVAQDHKTGEVLMLAYINEESWNLTLQTGKATYWSRSRKKLWIKGETSGNYQIVKEIYIDCDADAVIFKIEQIGGSACHTGNRTCFFSKIEFPEVKTPSELWEVTAIFSISTTEVEHRKESDDQ